MTWMTRRPEPTPEPTLRPAEVVVSRPTPRLGRGVCWRDIAAEIDAEGGSETGGNAIPNPWSPDPEEAA
jgi:hypothetical protein